MYNNRILGNSVAQNALRWRGQKRFYEVYFLKFNNSSEGWAFWLRFTIRTGIKDMTPLMECWVIFFNATNGNIFCKDSEAISFKDFKNPDRLIGNDNWFLKDGFTYGRFKHSHQIEWEISYDTKNKMGFLYFPYTFMYSGPFPKTKATAPYLNTRFSGYIKIDNKRFEFLNLPGEQEHYWGTQFADSWAWAHCNSFEEDALFLGLCARVKIAGIPTPYLSIYHIELDRKSYDFCSLKNMLFSKNRFHPGEWNFYTKKDSTTLKGTFHVDRKHIVKIEYTDTDGSSLFCYNSKLADAEIEISTDGKKKYLIAKQSAAFEVVTRDGGSEI